MKHLAEDMQLLDESMEDAVDELLSGSALRLGRSNEGDVTTEDSSDGGSSDADGDGKFRCGPAFAYDVYVTYAVFNLVQQRMIEPWRHFRSAS